MWKTKCKAGNRVRGDLLCRPCHMHHTTRYFTSNVSNHFVHLVLFAGVIERNPELFKPKLPKEKTSSMQKMVFGTVNKIFIAYEKPFLHPDITEVGSDYWKYLKPANFFLLVLVAFVYNCHFQKIIDTLKDIFKSLHCFPCFLRLLYLKP